MLKFDLFNQRNAENRHMSFLIGNLEIDLMLKCGTFGLILFYSNESQFWSCDYHLIQSKELRLMYNPTAQIITYAHQEDHSKTMATSFSNLYHCPADLPSLKMF